LLQSSICHAREENMKKAIVVGTGAGGATAAKEIQGHFDVTILEAGKEFRPFPLNLKMPRDFKESYDHLGDVLWLNILCLLASLLACFLDDCRDKPSSVD